MLPEVAEEFATSELLQQFFPHRLGHVGTHRVTALLQRLSTCHSSQVAVSMHMEARYEWDPGCSLATLHGEITREESCVMTHQ